MHFPPLPNYRSRAAASPSHHHRSSAAIFPRPSSLGLHHRFALSVAASVLAIQLNFRFIRHTRLNIGCAKYRHFIFLIKSEPIYLVRKINFNIQPSSKNSIKNNLNTLHKNCTSHPLFLRLTVPGYI